MKSCVSGPTGAHTATLIFLHGLGDTGYGWFQMLKEILPSSWKLVCPHAPSIPVTLNGGMRMPSWFDIKGLSPNSPQDEAGILRGKAGVEALIDEELSAGLDASRIVLGGFSMGGALALYTGLTTSRGRLGGLVALSAWMPLHQGLMADPSQVVNRPPVFQGHGDSDPTVLHPMGEMTHRLLLQLGMADAKFKTYAGLGHSSSDQELADVRRFVTSVVSAPASV